MAYKIKELETNVMYDDFYESIEEAKKQIAIYEEDDKNPNEKRITPVTYVVIDMNNETIQE